MESYGQRLARAMKLRGRSGAELARALGVKPQAIYQVLSGSTKSLTADNHLKAARFLSLSPDWLASGRGDMTRMGESDVRGPTEDEWASSRNESGGSYSQGVPLLEWRQLDDPTTVTQEPPTSIPCPVPHGPRTFAARVRGDAMWHPNDRQSFGDGDLIFVDPDRAPEHRKPVLVRRAGVALFRQYLVEPEGIMLAALNPAWPDRLVRVDDSVEIVGAVIFGGRAL